MPLFHNNGYIVRRVIDDLNYFILLLLAVVLPFGHVGTNVVTAGLIIIWIVDFDLTKVFGLFKSRLFILFTSIYFLHVAALAYTENISNGVTIVTKSLSLLVYPVIILSMPHMSRLSARKIFVTFAISCSIASIVCLLVAFYKGFYQNVDSGTSQWKYFTYHDFSSGIGHNASYFAMYVCFSIFIVYYFLLKQSSSKRQKIWYLFWISFLIVILALLATRMTMLALFIITTAYFSFEFLVNKSISKRAIWAGIGVMLVTVTIIFSIPRNRERLYEAVNFSDSIDLSSENSLGRNWGGRALRAAIWICSMDVIKEHPIIGVSPGDTQDKLQESYEKNNFGFAAYYNRYPAHNQYIQTTLALGLIGLVVLLLNIFYPFYLAISRRELLYAAFLLLFAICCLTESYLTRNKGIVFYSFFNAIFAFHFLEKKKSEPISKPSV
ncbi:MAG: O-antigen ligase family protein [Bacteroidota bacterium]